MCNTYLEITKEAVVDNRYGIHYIHTQTLIDDICRDCTDILNCGFHSHIDKINKRRKKEGEMLKLKKKVSRKRH